MDNAGFVMSRFTGKTGKINVAVVFAPLVLALAAFTVPVYGDGTETVPPMTFDSVGSMLQDMDREQSLADAGRHASPAVPGQHSGDRCQSADADAALELARSRAASSEDELKAAAVEAALRAAEAALDSQP